MSKNYIDKNQINKKTKRPSSQMAEWLYSSICQVDIKLISTVITENSIKYHQINKWEKIHKT